ncbi:MAG TPA: membrane protein insertase YidC [Thermodesulfobacteriota bacterium]
MESKRLLLATILSIAIILGYQAIAARFFPPPEPAPGGRAAPSPAASVAPSAGDAATATTGPAPGAAPVAAAPAPAVPQGERVTVRTEQYEMVFSTATAGPVEVRLPDYRASKEPGAPPVALADLAEGALVPTLLVPGGQRLLPPGTLYTVEPAGGLVLEPGQEGTLTFTAEAPGGVRVVNRYIFEAAPQYAFRLEQTVTNSGGQPVGVQAAWVLRHARDVEAERAAGYSSGALVRSVAGVRREDFEDVGQGFRVPGPVDWAGWQEKYFAGVVLPRGPQVEAVVVGEQPAGSAVTGGAPQSGAATGPVGVVQVVYQAAQVAPGGSVTASAGQIYMGPKDVGELRKVDPRLEQVIHLGFFHWIAMPLLLTLRWLHGILGNYGLAIIALTILIKLVFWPLTAKQIRSSKAMARIQPEMTRLREKYKNDREALNREMMQLFRKHNVNPLMGCLPLLVQIPVFFALYQVLSQSIELRHAPFAGWIQDLSAMDPYYATPILMGVSMFVTQRMTPMPGMDPTQQKLMLIMPAMMSVFFLWMPSGLVLYWLVMNVLQIAQQAYANRISA